MCKKKMEECQDREQVVLPSWLKSLLPSDRDGMDCFVGGKLRWEIGEKEQRETLSSPSLVPRDPLLYLIDFLRMMEGAGGGTMSVTKDSFDPLDTPSAQDEDPSTSDLSNLAMVSLMGDSPHWDSRKFSFLSHYYLLFF